MEWYWWVVIGIGLIVLIWLFKTIFVPAIVYLFARRHTPRTGQALENIVQDRIPGFEHYKTEEDARIAQKRQRVRLAEQLGEKIAEIRRLINRLLDEDKTGPIEALDRLIRRIEAVADRIRYASYGYVALFEPVDENILDLFASHDQHLESTVSQIVGIALEGEVDLQRQLETINGLVDHLDHQLNERPVTARR